MTEGKKAVFIIPQSNFRDEEFKIPKDLLEKNNVQVTVASTTLRKVRGMLGLVVQPDKLVNQIKVTDYDLVFFVGGSGASQYWNDRLAHEIARQTLTAGRVLAASCIAPVTLANAGVLKGKKCTVWPSENGALKAAGAATTGRDLEIDGLIVTAAVPEASGQLAAVLLEKLK